MYKKYIFALVLGVSLIPYQPATKAQQPLVADSKPERKDRLTEPFDRKWLESKAMELATKEYQVKQISADNPLSQMSYDDYKKIQLERGSTIWSKENRNFRVNPLHPGFLFKIPVKLNLVVNGVARRVFYTTKIFNYDSEQEELKNTDAQGYSGFSVTHPINTQDKWDEFLVFQGGSYFRAVGQTNWYGLSARGLAINTAKPSGEEFPVFTEFWLERPNKNNDKLIIHALMESESLTGAFTFTVKPQQNTEILVNSTLYPRRDIESFGIAPLTSMFLFNGMNRSRFDDFRPAVHDSDGLLMIKANNEKIWRPLANPKRLQVSAFEDDAIKGFGLMQRSRNFNDFNDMEAHYHKRPSAWITPINDWGAGHVELVEIPTKAEIHDNIVAFWQPNQILKAGQPREFSYKISWGNDAPVKNIEGKIVTTAAGKSLGSETAREFVIEYAGQSIPSDLSINAITSSGQIVGVTSQIIPETNHLRVVAKFEPGAESVAELRVSLSQNDKQWGETWLYRWTK
ncbi:glucan biosynthesis protein [Paraglaciecola arctica]|uniref:glucan biosynthesis protein n=1 Tax=Paraglaciecola arctica TaxID=1128911 RepID=UPI001C076BD4|nr:glucan biosynthesis protein G [Paraglaciecola arctica]MBU3006286.1 glucan biosynthesis protein G [Paraglaciecola arctica]